MKRASQRRPQKSRIFVGCEGASERSYAAWLQILCNERNVSVHLDIHDLGQAGSPIAAFERAGKIISREQKNKDKYSHKIILIDTDWLAETQQKTQCEEQARRLGLIIIWQHPCHEAFLLRHFLGCEHDQPATTAESISRLKQLWPDYKKNTSAHKIQQRLTIEGALSVAQNLPQFRDFLNIIGLLVG